MLDPDFNGRVTIVPVLVDYRYEGTGRYRNEEGYRIGGKYAVRYKQATKVSQDPDLQEVQGTHDVMIYLSLQKGGLRFITETFKEEYKYRTGRSLRLEGTVATFFEGVVPLDTRRIGEAFGIPRSDTGPKEATREPPVYNGGFPSQAKLSLARAKAIVDALVRMGIPQDRFLYEGRGAEEPIAPNVDEKGRAQNRRVEITILEK